MAAVVLQNGARIGERVVIVATVDGVRHVESFSAADLDRFPTKTARQNYIAAQIKIASALSGAQTVPSGSILDVSGTITA